MHKHTAVVLDVDGVLYPYDSNLALVAQGETGKPASAFPPAAVWAFFSEQWGMTLQEYLDLVDVGVAKYGLIREGEPFKDAVTGVHALLDMGVHVHIATDVGTDGDPKGHRAARIAWLNKLSPRIADIDVTFTADKAAVAKTYLDQDFLVYGLDDKVENYRSLNEVGAICYLLDQLWNLQEPNARRVATVLQLAQKIRVDQMALA